MPADRLTLLLLGDVIGKPGRKALSDHLAAIVEETGAGFVVVNAENASGGLGLTPEVATEMLRLPVGALTTGNHIWKHKEIQDFMADEPRLLRPANYPEGTPGRGFGVFHGPGGISIAVLNLQGLLFMTPLPCPFRTADRLLQEIGSRARIVLVDFHAEATSEKRALGFYLASRVTAVVGTHTHVPTADAEVLPGGTGYLTDLGMCGPTDSVIGVRKEMAIQRFITHLPNQFQVARDRIQLQGAVLTVDATSGRCLEIAQRSWPVSV